MTDGYNGIWSTVSNFGVPSTRKVIKWSKFSGGPLGWSYSWSTCSSRRELGMFRLEKRPLGRDLTAAFPRTEKYIA
ncbi:hypothetical protein QYF61_013655 [Mycteria americana]|uniref:Uncharacterized protein n=1 Tax=Mycteria americana TaxID=33587 RepID=A0AAN7NHR9_MYCAM|nr:hypothetical protein QYF61_013655 [Mycteria americana]